MLEDESLPFAGGNQWQARAEISRGVPKRPVPSPVGEQSREMENRALHQLLAAVLMTACQTNEPLTRVVARLRSHAESE